MTDTITIYRGDPDATIDRPAVPRVVLETVGETLGVPLL